MEVVLLEEDANCLPVDARHQIPLDRLLRYETNRPSSLAFRRRTTNHRKNRLFFRVFEQLGGAWPLPIMKSQGEITGTIAMGTFPNGLGCNSKQSGDLRCDHDLRNPQQSQRAQGDPDLLNPSTQQIEQVLLVFCGNLDSEGGANQTPGMP